MSMASGMAMLGRVTAEALMESVCVITRKTGETVDASGANVPTLVTIYTGKCRLRMDTRRADEIVAAGQMLARQHPILGLPVGALGSGNVLPDDIATFTINPLDPALVGKSVRVTGIFAQTHATARRFPVEFTN